MMTKGSELRKKTAQYATHWRGYQNIDFWSYNGKLKSVVDKRIKNNMTGNILQENQSAIIESGNRSSNTGQLSEIDFVNFTSSILKSPES